jgi:hypothetical protein
MLSPDSVLDYHFIREIKMDVYKLLEVNYMVDDIIRKIIEPQPSLNEVFDLSVFLYGCYEKRHIGIRVNDKSLYADWINDSSDISAGDIKYSQEEMFPLFLNAGKLYQKTINFKEELFLLSFSHKSTRVNYWRFQLWTKDIAMVTIYRYRACKNVVNSRNVMRNNFSKKMRRILAAQREIIYNEFINILRKKYI